METLLAREQLRINLFKSVQIIEKSIFVCNKRYHASIKNIIKVNILNIIGKYHDFHLHFLFHIRVMDL